MPYHSEDSSSASEQKLELDPNNAHDWNKRGIALAHLKRYPEALSAFERAIELDPSQVRCWRNKAHVLFDLKTLSRGADCN
jgi:cytochrome c-type biogenesis protein CcmH/NrfG